MFKRRVLLHNSVVSLFCILHSALCILGTAVAGEREDYVVAYRFFEDEKYFLAKDLFKKFLQDYPDSENADDARFLMGESALRLKTFDEAIQHFRQLEIDYPASPLRLDAVRGIGNAWYGQGKYEEAIKAFEKVVEKTDDAKVTSHALYVIGESYDNLGLYQKAAEYYDRIIKGFPQADEAPDAHYAKGWSLYRLKQYQAAYETLTRFIQQYASYRPEVVAEATYRAAESLFQLGDWEQAQAAFENVIDTYQGNEDYQRLVVDARFRLGECFFQQRRMEEAKRAFESLLQHGGAAAAEGTSAIAPHAQYWVAEVLLEQKEYTQAVYEYQKVINLYPQSDVVDDAQFGIAMAYFLQADYARARTEFKAVAEDLRSDLVDAARFRMGESFRLLREFNSAILHYKKVASKSEYADDALYGLATSAFELRDYAQAAGALTTLLQAYPKSPLRLYALYQLGLAYFSQGSYQPSVATFDQFLAAVGEAALETAPTDEALFWKARGQFELADYAGTIATCEQLLQRFPNSKLSYRAEFFIAESTYWKESSAAAYQSARKQYEALLQKQPQGEWAEKCRYAIGWTHFSEASLSQDGAEQNKRYRAAIQAWRESLKNHPSGELADKTQYHVGVALVNLKQYNDAIQAFETVISTFPGSNWQDDARYQIGWSYYKQERYGQAVTVFNEMLNKHPGSPLVPKAIFGIGNAYFKQGQFAQAIRAYQRVVEEYPNPIQEPGTEKVVDLRPEAQYYIAESYLGLPNYNEAIRAYEKVIQHHPESEWADDAQYGIATAYENLGQKEKALEAYRQLTEKYSGRGLAPNVQIQIGRFYYDERDYKRAIAEFQKAINQYPNTSASWLAQYYIGKCYIALGSYREAIAAFERVNPQSELAPIARYEIGYAWYDRNNPNRSLGNAVKALLELADRYPNSPDVPRALLLAGECYRELLELEKAEDTYNLILERFPTSKQAEFAQLSLGDTLRDQKKYEQAIVAYNVIREKGTDRYPVDIVIDGLLRLAETQSLTGKHHDAGVTYLRIPYLYKDQDTFRALQATVFAADAFVKAAGPSGQAQYLHMAKDEYENAVDFYENNVSSIQDSATRRKWTQVHDYAQKQLQQVLNRLGQG